MDKSELIAVLRELDGRLSSSEAQRDVLVRVMDHVSGVRPDWAQRIRYFLLEQGWEIE